MYALHHTFGQEVGDKSGFSFRVFDDDPCEFGYQGEGLAE